LTGSPKLLSRPSLLELAKDAGCTPEQAVYNLAQTLGITPLSGTKDESHMQEAVAAEHIKLSEGRDLADVLQTVWDGGPEGMVAP
jgi:aryl-alcohol dehydrogenase-like predicted oxidoreductase